MGGGLGGILLFLVQVVRLFLLSCSISLSLLRLFYDIKPSIPYTKQARKPTRPSRQS